MRPSTMVALAVAIGPMRAQPHCASSLTRVHLRCALASELLCPVTTYLWYSPKAKKPDCKSLLNNA